MATGDSLNQFMPKAFTPPSSNAATFDFINRHPVLDFDGSVGESTIFEDVLPDHYDGGGINVFIHWSCDGTTGDVDWEASIERIGDGVLDIDADSFAAARSITNETVPGTSHEVKISSISFSNGAQMDSLAAGESYRLKITRIASADVNNDDANLVGVEIREQ